MSLMKSKGDQKSRNGRPSMRVKVLRPYKEEARDEGPRLIPLGTPRHEMPSEKIEHYMKLADIALKLPPSVPRL